MKRTGDTVSYSGKAATVLLLAALFSLALALMGYLICLWLPTAPQTGGTPAAAAGSGSGKMPTVILDAGHGGDDGGAVSAGGKLKEKDLNLSITLQLGEMLQQQGIRVVYTRTEDVSLDEKNIKGQHKLYDLKNRLLLAREYPGALFVSIHMNTFPSEKCAGLQVFYSKHHPNSALLAKKIQENNRLSLQPDNGRLAKAAGSSIYLLDRAKDPAVLVECGFLSNPTEAKELADPIGQLKICGMLCQSITDFLYTNQSDNGV